MGRDTAGERLRTAIDGPSRREGVGRGPNGLDREVNRASASRPTIDRVDDFLGTRARSEGRDFRGTSVDRSGNRGDVAGGRPSWSGDFRRTQHDRVHDNLRRAHHTSVRSAGTGNWLSANPARAQYWDHWAGGIRNHWHHHHYHRFFTPRWWAFNNVYFPWRHNYYWWGARPWSYWWSAPSWNTCSTWYSGWGWNTPYYYDYGYGGNVIYVDRYVYINGQPIASATEYALSAAELAATEPSPEVVEKPGEWLAMGTFAIAISKEDTDPDRVIQLAVDKEGNVSGTMVNKETGKTYPVQGHVDKETQRVAFTIGENQDVVLETGVYNLTQQETPVLAHQGTDRTETYVFLRIDEPPAEVTQEAAASDSLLP